MSKNETMTVKIDKAIESQALKAIKALDKSASSDQDKWLTIGYAWDSATESVRTEGKPGDPKGYDRKALGAYGLAIFADTSLVKPDKDNKPKLNSVILGDAKFMARNWDAIKAVLEAENKMHLRNPSRIVRTYRDSLKTPKTDAQREIDRAKSVLTAVTSLCDAEQENGIDRAAKQLLAQAYAILKLRFENDGDLLDRATSELVQKAKENAVAA